MLRRRGVAFSATEGDGDLARSVNRPRRPLLWLASLMAAAWLAVLLPSLAFAAYSTSQIGIDDDRYTTNSVRIDCPSMKCFSQQGATGFSQCFATPNTFTHDYNWWWTGAPIVNQFTSTNCSGTPFHTAPLSIGTSNPNPWYCYDYPQQGGWQC